MGCPGRLLGFLMFVAFGILSIVVALGRIGYRRVFIPIVARVWWWPSPYRRRIYTIGSPRSYPNISKPQTNPVTWHRIYNFEVNGVSDLVGLHGCGLQFHTSLACASGLARHTIFLELLQTMLFGFPQGYFFIVGGNGKVLDVAGASFSVSYTNYMAFSILLGAIRSRRN